MLRAPAVQARRRIRELCGSQAVMVAGSSRDGDEPVEDRDPTGEPPAKKIRPDEMKPKVKPTERNPRKRNTSPSEDDKESAAKKAKSHVPRRLVRIFYNRKYRRRFDRGSSSKEDLASSYGATGESSQGEMVMGDAFNNNEMTQKSKKRRRKRKRHAKVDKDGPIEKRAGLVEQVENSADEGVGSLVDLLDGMSVNEKPKTQPAATEAGSFFNHSQVASWTRCHWEKDFEDVSATTALRATVMADEISVSMFLNIETNLKQFFADCGSITQFGIPQFGATAPNFSIKVHFETEHAAAQALEKDGASFGEGVIRVRRPGRQDTALAAPGYSNMMPRSGNAFMSCTQSRSMSPDFDCEPGTASRYTGAAHGSRVHGHLEIDLSSDSD